MLNMLKLLGSIELLRPLVVLLLVPLVGRLELLGLIVGRRMVTVRSTAGSVRLLSTRCVLLVAMKSL